MSKQLLMFAGLAILAACGVVDPDPSPTPTGGAFEIAVDSVEVSGPGEARLAIEIADTTQPAITAPSPFAASLEVSGSNVKRTVLIIQASAPGVGYVKLANDRSFDSVKVVATAVSFKKIAVAYGFGCGLAADDRAWCWGANGTRQLGAATNPPCLGGGCQYGNGGFASMPLPVRGNLKFKSIAVAGNSCIGSLISGACGNACAITAAGEAYCWGAFSFAAQDAFMPVRAGPDRTLSGVVTATAGFSALGSTPTVCGLDVAGASYCLSASSSTRVGGSMAFTSFATSASHSCGIFDGDVYCWGTNANGELGIGATDTQQHASPEKAVAPVKFSSVAAGNGQTCALATDKRIFCWGRGSGTPAALAGGSIYESFALSSSTASVCGLDAGGHVDCWPSLSAAQPSRVDAPMALSAIGVGGFRDPSLTDTDFAMSCGITAGGELYCWNSTFKAMKGSL